MREGSSKGSPSNSRPIHVYASFLKRVCWDVDRPVRATLCFLSNVTFFFTIPALHSHHWIFTCRSVSPTFLFSTSLVRVSIPALHRLQLLARNSALLEKSINNLAYTNISSDVVSAPESICQNSTRSEQEDINDDVHFTVQIIELYKGESEVPAGEELTFVTGGNSALCGVDLTVGEEYLVGLYPGWNGDELYAQSCGLFRTWSSVTEEERTELESCDFDQSCDLTCGEFQVRAFPPSVTHQVLHATWKKHIYILEYRAILPEKLQLRIGLVWRCCCVVDKAKPDT